MISCLIFSENAFLILWVLLIISSVGLVAILFSQILLPHFSRKDAGIYDPPSEGQKYEIIVDEYERIYQFSIGKKSGQLPTRIAELSEDHLVLLLKKAKDSENYDITIKRNGPVLYKPPRMEHYTVMESADHLESHEIIGHKAEFRLAGKINKDRMVHYIELSLTSTFIINKVGRERMKFIVTVEKLQPGINTDKPLKGRLFQFGKSKNKSDSEEDDLD